MPLHALFRSGMVLPAKTPFAVFGDGDSAVTVTFLEKTYTAEKTASGWTVALPPCAYGGPYTMDVTFADCTETLTDVYVGDVILLAGQSNMQLKLKDTDLPSDAYTDEPLVRVYHTDRVEVGDTYTAKDGWVKCEKENAGVLSALGYLTGRAMHRKSGHAVGLITCYQGASVIESWVPAGTFEKRGICLTDAEKFCDHFTPGFQKWNQDGKLFAFALGQVLPFAVNAVAWYQGESDCSLAESRVYGEELCALIDVWRDAFHNPQLPFAVVQIADNAERAGEAWENIQKAQWDAQKKRPFVKTVICRDVCEDTDIHPRKKQVLGERLAAALLDFTERR
ncbi:MAG: hypothetical protein J6L00_00040 [Clostridia bacterium]|nr:hypothetical protein [Clostridia bacterium]